MNLSGKKFLVTGGTGFLGSGLVRCLLARGAKVRSLDNDSRGDRRRLADVGAELIQGDVRDAAVVREASRGIDCVCHLAYVNGTEHFYSNPEFVLDVAIRGMLSVLDCGAPELLLVSSSEVYQTPPSVPTDECAPLSVPDPLNPRYSYGGGKIISELLALHSSRFDRVVVVRPHNVYGPDMGREHVVPQLIAKVRELLKNETIKLPIQGTGQETRAFCFVNDAVAGFILALDRGEHRGIYHVGVDRETSISDLVAKIAQFFGRSIVLQPGALQPGSTLRRCPDISKLREIGYEPCVSLREGLALTIPWYLENT